MSPCGRREAAGDRPAPGMRVFERSRKLWVWAVVGNADGREVPHISLSLSCRRRRAMKSPGAPGGAAGSGRSRPIKALYYETIAYFAHQKSTLSNGLRSPVASYPRIVYFQFSGHLYGILHLGRPINGPDKEPTIYQGSEMKLKIPPRFI